MSFEWKTFIGVFGIVALTSFGAVSAQAADNDHFSLHTLFGTETLRSNVNAVRRQAAGMSADDRYKSLKNWVLPSETHPDFRVTGEFTPTDPSPLAIELEPYRFPSKRGGELVSPVFDLLETARESGRLEELFDEVNSLPAAPGTAALRAKLSLQVMIRFEQGQRESAEELFLQLFDMIVSALKNPEPDFTPEFHMLYRAAHRWEAYETIGELLGVFHENRYSLDYVLRTHLTTLIENYHQFLEGEPLEQFEQTGAVKDWVPATRSISVSRGPGFPPTQWRFSRKRELHLTSGHQREYLFYRTPLAGDYEVSGELHPFGNCYVMAGGLICGPRAGQNTMALAEFREELPQETVEPPFLAQGEWGHFRISMKDRQLQIFINDRLVMERMLGPNPDPWFGVRTLGDNSGAFRNLEISGSPDVPEELVLSSEAAFPGWVAYYLLTENSKYPRSHWKWRRGTDGQGEIIALRHDVLGSGCRMESLLRYPRPLVEDGSIEYDFVYVPGRTEAHPALDRLVFLLDPEGVRIHWLTDGKFDRTLVTPDHAVVEPQNRRGPGQLPLKEFAWNHLKLSIEGRSVALELNEQLIYERELETTNLRTFGLFRYGEQSEVRVRDVRMRGDWPKSVPPLPEQEFAEPQLVELETQLGELPAEFNHDFSIGGLPEKFFASREPQMAPFVAVEGDGVHVQFQAEAGWKNLALMPRFSLAGDFDVRAHFELQGHLNPEWVDGLAFMEVQLVDDESHSVRAMRGREPGGRQATRAQVMWGPIGEHRQLRDYSQTSWSRSGCFRIARVGDRLYSLFAPQDSSSFRVMHAEQINDEDVLMRGILLELAMRDGGKGHVIWKDLSIRAEGMKFLPSDQKPIRKLFAMDADGSNLRELTAPKFGLDHLGSPQFSSDGSRIVLDMSSGPTTTSHVVIMKRDGSDVTDLGKGCMPSLSRDGKTIVFSDPTAGIVIMDADGRGRKTIERSGWGAQYSPDGKYIACAVGSNIMLIDVETGKKSPLFEGDVTGRYSRIYWNFGWSHDAQAIAFKGQNRETGAPELAVVDLNKRNRAEVLYSANGIYEDFSFSPDNRSVLFAMNETGLTQSDLYLVHRARPGRIERLAGQPDEFRILDCDWSPDGKTIVFAALVDPVPVDWPANGGAAAGDN